MKRIGIIGGTTPESTCYYYRMYMDISRRKLGNHMYPPLLIHSINFHQFMNNPDGWEGRKRMLIDAARSLERAGAEIIALSANTPHIVFDDIREAVSVPMVSIIDTLVEEMRRKGVRKPLLLGTKTTMGSGFYTGKLEGAGFQVVVPQEEEQEEINRIIFEELALEKMDSRGWLLKLVERYAVEKGVDSVILGCTELPLAIREGDVPVMVLDTARIHMEKLIDLAIQ